MKFASPVSTMETPDSGSHSESIEIISDIDKARNLFLKLIEDSEREIELLMPTQNAFHREEIIGVLDAIEKGASQKGLRVRIISPIDEKIRHRIDQKGWSLNLGEEEQNSPSRQLLIRSIEKAHTENIVTILIVDKSKSYLLEQKDDSTLDFENAIGLCIYSISKPTVASYSAIFEKLWRESELRAREESSRRQSELLQDILTHDIRNYNQAARINAEVLAQDVKGNLDAEISVATILKAIDGSTELVDKAKKLGRIITEGKRQLHAVDLIEVIDRSLLLVKGANPAREIREVRKVVGSRDGNVEQHGEIQVVADELLDEVFVNILSNAVKFTPGVIVPIEITLEPRERDGKSFWKVSIADSGTGLLQDDKDSIFRRYTGSHKGSGLGLSIVYSLVVERYGGTIQAHNKTGDSTGAVFQIQLRSGGNEN
jgi:K+-sensing histidine kinase KdpD